MCVGGGGNFFTFTALLRSRYIIGMFLGATKVSNILLGMPKFLIFFGETVDAGFKPRYQEKMRVPPILGIDPLYGRVKFVLNAFIKIVGEIFKT